MQMKNISTLLVKGMVLVSFIYAGTVSPTLSMRFNDLLDNNNAIPTPGVAPHGLAWDGEGLWCADRASGIIHKLEPDSGVVMDEIKVKEPELHGLTIHEN